MHSVIFKHLGENEICTGDISLVWAIFNKFLRELPDPVFPQSCHSDLLTFKMANVFSVLPFASLFIVQSLADIFTRATCDSEAKEMTSTFLEIFTFTLFRPVDTEDKKHFQQALQYIFEHSSDLFPDSRQLNIDKSDEHRFSTAEIERTAENLSDQTADLNFWQPVNSSFQDDGEEQVFDEFSQQILTSFSINL